MAAPHPPAMTTTQMALYKDNDFLTLTTYLMALRNTRPTGDPLELLQCVPFVTAFRSTALRKQVTNVALPEDVSASPTLPSPPHG